MTENKNQQSQSKAGLGLVSFISGAIAGAAAVFFSRKDNREKAKETVDGAVEKAKEVKKGLKEEIAAKQKKVKEKTAKKARQAAKKAKKAAKKVEKAAEKTD